VQKIKRWEPTPKRPIGRPKIRWENDVWEDIKSINISTWKNVAQNEDNIVQKIKRWEPVSKRLIGRPKTRWEDDVLEDIKSINISNWKKVAQNRDSWKKAVEQAGTLYRL